MIDNNLKMSYIEELRQSKNKAQVAYQEFALSTKKLPTHLFCFFEGKDNPYYVPRIKRFTERKRIPYIILCNHLSHK